MATAEDGFITGRVFTPERRERVRGLLLDRAAADPRITGAAVTGSQAAGSADRWSDIDLFFGVADGHAVRDVLESWSAHVYAELGALHHFDLHSGPGALPRVPPRRPAGDRSGIHPGRRVRPGRRRGVRRRLR